MDQDRRKGTHYRVAQQELETFRRDGYVHLRGVLSEPELQEIERDYMRFLRGEIEVAGRDMCDMAADYASQDVQSFALINVVLPRRYLPEWRDNLYEQRARSIAAQLIGEDIDLDYDQLLAKRPQRPNAVFHWHQDQAYWPATPDTRTATLWLALDDSDRENGCMRFVPGSHLEPALRPHRPLHGDRDTSHTLVADVDEQRDLVRLAEIRRGDVTVHHERVIHGSGGNSSERWRRAYVVAFRSRDTVARERAMGFSHSHNDAVDVLHRVDALEGADEAPRKPRST